MKRLLTILGLITITQYSSQTFGVKGGLNVSTISKDNGWNDTNSKLGFHVGAYMHAQVNEKFSIQPELLYNNMGVKYETGSSSRTIILDYIVMPIMFQFEPVANFYVEAGPQIGFLVNNKNKFRSDDKVVIEKDSNAYNNFDLNVGLGLGYRFGKYGLSARYLFGFTDIKQSGSTSWSNEGKQLRNNALQISLQYSL